MLYLLKRIAVTLLTLAFLWFAGFVWFTLQIPSAPSQDTAQADAIVVLTGGSLRIEHGFTLLLENKAPLLFISGVDQGTTLPALLHGKELSIIADKIPQERVELGYAAHSTLQNAAEIKFWAAKHGIKSLRLVTGNYHMPRSVYLLHQAMPEISIFADPVFPPEFSGNVWWLSGPSLRLMLSEYHKYLASSVAVMLGIISDD